MRLELINDWQELIGQEFEQPYFEKLKAFISDEYSHQTIYPEHIILFRINGQMNTVIRPFILNRMMCSMH